MAYEKKYLPKKSGTSSQAQSARHGYSTRYRSRFPPTPPKPSPKKKEKRKSKAKSKLKIYPAHVVNRKTHQTVKLCEKTQNNIAVKHSGRKEIIRHPKALARAKERKQALKPRPKDEGLHMM